MGQCCKLWQCGANEATFGTRCGHGRKKVDRFGDFGKSVIKLTPQPKRIFTL